MSLLYEYNTFNPIPFKITKNGEAVAGLTFSANDITVSVDDGSWTDVVTAGEISEAVGVGLGKGWYLWTPTSGETTGKYVIFNLAEVSGTNFDENGMILQLGGNAGAWLAG